MNKVQKTTDNAVATVDANIKYLIIIDSHPHLQQN